MTTIWREWLTNQAHQLIDRLTDQPSNWVTDWLSLTDQPTEWSIDWSTNQLIEWLIDWLID